MVRDYDPDLSDQEIDDAYRFCFSGYGTCLMVFIDGEPAGFMQYLEHGFFFKKGPVYYLADLYVKPEYRRHGIARQLLTDLFEKGRAENWARLYWITDPDNPIRPLYDEFAKYEFVRYHADLKS